MAVNGGCCCCCYDHAKGDKQVDPHNGHTMVVVAAAVRITQEET